jgi:hypothetical protein
MTDQDAKFIEEISKPLEAKELKDKGLAFAVEVRTITIEEIDCLTIITRIRKV